MYARKFPVKFQKWTKNDRTFFVDRENLAIESRRQKSLRNDHFLR